MFLFVNRNVLCKIFCLGCSSNWIKYINVDDIKMCNKIWCGFYYPYECIELFLALFRLSLLSSVSSINALCLLLLLYVPDNDLWFYIKAKMNGTNGGINNFMTLSIHINILHFGQIFTLLLLGLSWSFWILEITLWNEAYIRNVNYNSTIYAWYGMKMKRKVLMDVMVLTRMFMQIYYPVANGWLYFPSLLRLFLFLCIINLHKTLNV